MSFKYKRPATGAPVGASCIGIVLLVLIIAFIGGFCIEYSIEKWAAFFGNPVDVPYPHLATLLAGALVGKVFVPVAIITWLLAVSGVL